MRPRGPLLPTLKLRRSLLYRLSVAATAAAVASCTFFPDDVADPARGAGVAAAVSTTFRAVRISDAIRTQTPETCRPPAQPSGVGTVETRVVWTLKRPGLGATHLTERVVWRRDKDGDVSIARTLDLPLPDGRRTTRSSEDRVVGGRSFAALDGRFADASRVPDLPDRATDGAFVAVDALLSLVAINDKGALVPASDSQPPVCTPARWGREVPEPWSAAHVEWTDLSRRGWLRWDDPAQDATLIVTFEEHRRTAAEDVHEPEQVWPVESDRAYARTEEFVRAGLREGWLSGGVFDEEPNRPSGSDAREVEQP